MKVLFLDFDGVLHPFSVYAVGNDFELHWEDKTIELFCWAPILDSMLNAIDVHGQIKIVLSTSWGHRLGWREAAKHLPEGLQLRVVGGTYPAPLARGNQVELHAMDYEIADADWIAIDDDDFHWPTQHLEKLVKSDPELGLSCEQLQAHLRKKLENLLLL